MKTYAASFLAAAFAPESFPPQGPPEVAFAGRSNVGKSSLLGALIGRRGLVRTSRAPGCTRTINFFDVQVEGTAIRLVDLPGYGYAGVSIAERRSWAGLVEAYLSKRSSLRGVVVIVDPRREPGSEEHALLELLAELGRPVVVVATKIDKVPRSRRAGVTRQLEGLLGRDAIAFSAEDYTGREPLWDELKRLCGIV